MRPDSSKSPNDSSVPSRSDWVVWGCLAISFLLNVALILALWAEKTKPREIRMVLPAPPVVTNIVVHTNVVVETHSLQWSDLASPDYPTYVANLRAIGCPEPTIRTILLEELEEFFRSVRLREVPRPEYQWWRSEPDPQFLSTIQAKEADLEQKKRALLEKILGPDWDQEDLEWQVEEARPLEGPVLGSLTEKQRARARALERQFLGPEEVTQRPIWVRTNLTESELMRWSALRKNLIPVLSSDQTEEYLLRYSPWAALIRGRLMGVVVTPEEFRQIFHTVLTRMEGMKAADAVSACQTPTFWDSVLSTTLPPEKYATVQILQMPSGAEYLARAQQAGIRPSVAVLAATIEEEARAEWRQIQTNKTLSLEERQRLWNAVQNRRLEALRKILSREQLQRWLGETQD